MSYTTAELLQYEDFSTAVLTLNFALDLSNVRSDIWADAEHLCKISQISDFYSGKSLPPGHVNELAN